MIFADKTSLSAIPLKPTVDKALEECPEVRTVLVSRRTGGGVRMSQGRDLWLEEAMAGESDHCQPVEVDAEDPLFLLYTSGSTGKPKVTSDYEEYFPTSCCPLSGSESQQCRLSALRRGNPPPRI